MIIRSLTESDCYGADCTEILFKKDFFEPVHTSTDQTFHGKQLLHITVSFIPVNQYSRSLTNFGAIIREIESTRSPTIKRNEDNS